ncbi:hypothetical protein SLE2022_335830 [Rubroshorea leprosula]
MRSSPPRRNSSAALVGANNDLIREILLRMPAKNAVRLKLVSKSWLSLISDISLIPGRNSNATSGLIIMEGGMMKPRYSYVSLDESKRTTDDEPTRYIRFFDPRAPAPLKISDSCNGLFLCYAKATAYQDIQSRLYVVNPSTHQFTTLPLPPTHQTNWKDFRLVSDPCKSPVYLVYGIELSDSDSDSDSVCNILEYSSLTGVWNLFPVDDFDLVHRRFKGAFCNGALHWVRKDGYSYRFDVSQKSIKKLPKPPLPEYWKSDTDLQYFGEYEGNLYFIAHDTGSSTLIVYELHKDCSGWFMKYSLAIRDINIQFQMSPNFQQLGYLCCSVLSLVKVKNEGPKLVMWMRTGKIISYSFKDNTFSKHCDHLQNKYGKCKAFKF